MIINSDKDNETYKMAIKTRKEIVFGWDQCRIEIEKMNYSEKTTQICIQAANNNEKCAIEEIIKHYKKGTAGFEQSSDDAKKWQNILNNLIGKARSPQSGWSGDLKDCDN